MELFILSNLTAWNLQIALLTGAGAILSRALGIDAPSIRHGYWRTLLLIGLLLPFVQTWQVLPSADAIKMSGTIASAPSRSGSSSPRAATVATPSLASELLHTLRARWPASVGVVLVAGIAIRCAWLLAGILRLRRMRRLGAAHPAMDDVYDEVAALVQTAADVRRVPGLGQPVTFGVWRPTVLLPDSFDDLPVGVRRAVLAHELWHVRRRDWAWLIAEEVVRGAFWFNPAMWWLIAHVQRSREEVVDELTIQLTNARRTYVETLLRFADENSLCPAAPIASRRHLVQRMLLISKEARMSSRRIVGGSMVAMLAIVGTIAYSTSAFPLSAANRPSASSARPSAQAPVRDRRPSEAAPETARERELKQQLDDLKPKAYLELAALQEQRRAMKDAEATLTTARAKFANSPSVLLTVAAFYNRAGQFDNALSAYEQAAALDPTNPQGFHQIASFYWEKAFKDQSLRPAEKTIYLHRGIEAADRALAIDPNDVDSLVYKNLLLRTLATLDPSRRDALIAEADMLRSRAQKLQTAMKFQLRQDGGRQDGVSPPPPPPPPPPPADSEWAAALRVGGNIRPPTKVKDVKPVYPPIAQASGVQGVVILEAMIDASGRIAGTRVLRGQPLLDQAALDAVRQWEFTPTEVGGTPVPVIMTMSVNFALQQKQQPQY